MGKTSNLWKSGTTGHVFNLVKLTENYAGSLTLVFFSLSFSFSFQSRKYGDMFAEKLSTILPEFKMLKKLE